MYYLDSDVTRLLDEVTYLRLMKPEGALQYWKKLRDDGTELNHILRQFPSVQYQPLAALYACARASATLDEKLISDLTTHFSWQGIVQASFLAALSPQTTYAGHLQRAHEHAPRNQWIVDLALDEISGTDSKSHPVHQRILRELRDVVSNLAAPEVRLRPAPTAAQLLQLQAESAEISAVYKKSGAAQARIALGTSGWRNFL